MDAPALPGLKPEHVQHPQERRALGRLVQRLDAAPLVGREVERWEQRLERRLYELNLADNVKLGPEQGKSVWGAARFGASALGMPTPSLFLDTRPEQNALAFGSGDGSSITLTSALLEQTSREMLEAVIAHELGHLFCHHTRHRLLAGVAMGSGLEAVLGLPAPLIVLRVVIVGFGAVLQEWYRKSELTADRVALLLTRDLQTVQAVLLHVAGGSPRLAGELSTPAFIEQARELATLREEQRRGPLSERLRYFLSPVLREELGSMHPWPVTRLLEVTAWATSDQYERLLAGKFEKPEAEADGGLDDTKGDGAHDRGWRRATTALRRSPARNTVDRGRKRDSEKT